MGDHPNGPSHTVKNNKPLADLIAAHPEEYLTFAVFEKFNKDAHLPFLFKILSFRKALPLQAHPDKSLAEQLMRQEKREKGRNEQFVDPNHKPEVSVTASDLFEGFVGFRPINEIKLFLKQVPELRDAVGNENAVDEFLAAEEQEKTRGLLKTLFWSLFKRDKEDIAKLCQALLARMHLSGEEVLGSLGKSQNLGPVVKKILMTYPEDVGMFAAVFFTNFVRLRRGEGIAIPADCIHAYLEGDAIECMAWSDSMVFPVFKPPIGWKTNRSPYKHRLPAALAKTTTLKSSLTCSFTRFLPPRVLSSNTANGTNQPLAEPSFTKFPCLNSTY